MLREGTVLDGKYEILKQIGEGGMSIVYLARNNRMNMQLAVKEIKNDGSKSTEILLKGLEREANILKDVDHPVIPRIIDIVKHGGTICVVMDFIEGENLSDKLREVGAFSQSEVIDWGLELASALEYLHSMNPPIIYRDMKPSNVMLKPDGGVKLIDFGTAKTYEIENNADTTALGTRGYAAPEQFGDAQGRGIYKTDARTDIYNLGATMYHMVTGKNPQEPPYEMVPIRQVNPALSTGLEEIILKCTKPNPEDRYQSCSELIYALEHYNELDVSYKNANKKKVTLFAASAALTIFFAIIAIAGKTGINKTNKNQYFSYIESGDSLRAEGKYVEAADEYKNAFELEGEDGEAYVKYLDACIYADRVASQDEETKSDTATSYTEAGLSTVATKIKSGYADVDKNSEVLYKMGITYFTEEVKYSEASSYFEKIDKTDKNYGELADYYGSIALAMTATDINRADLAEKLNGFSTYNMNNFTNDNERKFENYSTIGTLYAQSLGVEGVPEKTEEVMNQALSDLEDFEGETKSDYFYGYNKILAEAYLKQAEIKNNESYYKLAIGACSTITSTVRGRIKVDTTEKSDSIKALINDYVAYVCKQADAYKAIGDHENVIKTYTDAETDMKEGNSNAEKLYLDHLNYLYTRFEAENQDPANWTEAQRQEVLAVYHAAIKISGIEANPNLGKRIDDLQKMDRGDFSKKPEEPEAPAASQGDVANSEEGE